MTRLVSTLVLLMPLLVSAVPIPNSLLGGLLGHGHRPPSSGAGAALNAVIGPNLQGVDYHRGTGMGRPAPLDLGLGGLKRSFLGDLGPILGPVDPIIHTATDAVGPVAGPLSPALKPLAVLGIDLELLTPTDLLCAKVEGEFIGKAYALGCVCLGQDGLLLTAEAGVTVIDGLVDWITAQVHLDGFNSLYPEYGIPTCERHIGDGDDGGEFRCPPGKERKPNGKCAAILIASTSVRSSTVSPGPTGPAGTPSPTPAPTAAPTPSPQAVVESAPTPPPTSPASSSGGATSATPAGPASSAGTGGTGDNGGKGNNGGNGNGGNGNNGGNDGTGNNGNNGNNGSSGNGNNGNTGNNGNNGGGNNGNGNDSGANTNSTPVDEDDGEDLPYCDEIVGWVDETAIDADEAGKDGGERVQVQTTSTETITIPATAFVQMETQTITQTVTSTVTSTSTITSTATSTRTETVYNGDCQQSVNAAAIAPAPGPTAGGSGPASSPAPAPSPTAAPAPIDVAALPSSSASPSPTASQSATAPPGGGPTPTPDDTFKPNGAQLIGKHKPHPASCPPGQVMGATMCCRADQIERNGECGCKDGWTNLIDLCVEICLPPLSLVDGKCLKLDLGIASDLTQNLGLGDPTHLVGGVLGGGNPLGGAGLPVGGLLGGGGVPQGGLGGLGLL